jgi:hypothetical protein
MKFIDLINFRPIESVIQIKDSNDESKATEYVKTYVISPRISEELSNVVIPNLQFEDPYDNKGLMIIGNYGTGKSHLLSVISSVAEYSGILNNLQDPDVIESCKKIAGKFIVFRIELGAVRQNLRDIICNELETFLDSHNISYQFPSTNIANNKQALEEMMIKFQEKFPEKGFLLVIDELLAYLMSRNQHELISDLEFLRELGEFCKSSKFRFLSGLQAKLFDDSRFSGVADTLRRVKDRFTQFTIGKSDLDYVISQRLLNKTQEQKDNVDTHLRNFISYYPTLQNKFDEFVDMYPLHPSYTEILERVGVVEKRHIFESVSKEIKQLLDIEMNSKTPGIISFDSYWKIITSDNTLRSDENIRQVINASSALENKIKDAMEDVYKDMAIRIIHALSVHRLTGFDISTPLGMTTANLRDMLFLYAQMPEDTPGFLETTIETTLDKIRKSTDGSFISQNPENLEWYIDVKKDIDYDAKIDKNKDSLDASKNDRYFFEILQKAMEADILSRPFGDYKIHQCEIEWHEKRINRNGYLFFGTPNERETAQPPRDFYLYFLQYFKLSSFEDEKKSDEVFFKFKNIDSVIEEDILFYCSSRSLEETASGEAKKAYSNKSEQRFKKIITWIREQGLSNIEVTYKGTQKVLLEIPILKKGTTSSFKEIIDAVGSYYLKEHFEQKYPNYPEFEISVTNENTQQYVKECIKCISTGVTSKISNSILSSLGLLNNDDAIDPSNSKYAQAIKNELEKKGTKEVLNRDEFMMADNSEEFQSGFHLENDWVLVILCAMVHDGDLVIGYSGRNKITANDISEINNLSYDEQLQFKHVQRPTDIPVPELKELSILLELTPGLFSGLKLDSSVEKLQNKIIEKLTLTLELKEQILDGMRFWNIEIYDSKEQQNLKNTLDNFKDFLDGLRKYDTSAKIKNFKLTKDEIIGKQPDNDLIKNLEQISKILSKLSPLTGYLSQTNTMQSSENYISISSEDKFKIMNKIKQNPTDQVFQEVKSMLEEIKKSFIQEYYNSHKKSRLDSSSKNKLESILDSDLLKKLQRLRHVVFLDQSTLSNLETEFGKLKSCSELEKSELDSSPVCEHCNYTPFENGVFDSNTKLSELELELSSTVQNVTNSLLENLKDPTVKPNLDLLEGNKKKIISEFISNALLPDTISDTFSETLNEVFLGLDKAILTLDEIKDYIQKGGMPCKQEDLESRFSQYLEEKTKGKTKSKVRFVLD